MVFDSNLFENFCDSFFLNSEYMIPDGADSAVGFVEYIYDTCCDIPEQEAAVYPVVVIKTNRGVMIPVSNYMEFEKICTALVEQMNNLNELDCKLTLNRIEMGSHHWFDIVASEN